MDVDAILSSKQGQFKSSDVEKEIQLQFDLYHLVASDLNTVDTDALKKNKDEYLKELSRDNTQLLLNKLWELPTEKVDGFVLAQLPTPTTVLPREKPIPKPKPPTKWETFAKDKGIKNQKRSRMTYDEKTQEYKPRWGFKRIDDPKDNWVLEVPDNADPYEDQFEKKSDKRKELIAKNEYQRLRNIAKVKKSGRIKAPLPPPLSKDLKRDELTQALKMAKASTASVGKFTPSLPKEPLPKREKKRRFTPVVGDVNAERQKNLDILEKIGKGKKQVLDTKKAANMLITSEQKRKRPASSSDTSRPSKKQKTSRKVKTFSAKGGAKTRCTSKRK